IGLRPEVLLLDEPAAGVPSAESHIILDAIERLPEHIAVLIIAVAHAMAARQLPERDIGVAIVKCDLGPVDLFGHHFSSVRPSSMTLPGAGAAPPPLADQILGRALTSAGGGVRAKSRYAKLFAPVTFQFPPVTFQFPAASSASDVPTAISARAAMSTCVWQSSPHNARSGLSSARTR